MHRFGRVETVNAAAATARVRFDADDDVISAELPVMQLRVGSGRAYWVPSVGEHVVCLLDEHAEDGVIIGGIYSAKDALPSGVDAGTVVLVLQDGVRIECSSGDVHIYVPAGKHVQLGGAGGDQLATKSFISDVFMSHVHAALGSPPVVTGLETISPHVTTKVSAE